MGDGHFFLGRIGRTRVLELQSSCFQGPVFRVDSNAMALLLVPPGLEWAPKHAFLTSPTEADAAGPALGPLASWAWVPWAPP